MKESLIAIIEEYNSIVKNETFGANNQLNKYFDDIRLDIVHLLKEMGHQDFLFKYAYGKGTWAIVPWFAILNPKITDSVSKGVYIVYLFSASEKSVYLTLNQGTGGTDKSRFGDEQKLISNSFLKSLKHESQNFTKGEMPKSSLDLQNRARPSNYEKACLLWKKYSLDELKKFDDSVLISDLNELLNVYSNNIFSEINFEAPIIISDKLNVDFFDESIHLSGLYYNKSFITRVISCLLTKPFVILTGLSGSGKTKLAQAFALWICESEDQYAIIPVGADWTNREPLLGFPNALEKDSYVIPDNPALKFLIEASKPENQHKPYFLILDEMNLSHVERYFADFLSVMESRAEISFHSGETSWNGVPNKINFPLNFFIIGTVNIDETTYMFSPKVLDRANVIEFRVTKNEMAEFLSRNQAADLQMLKAKGAGMANDFVRLAKEHTLKPNDKEEINRALLSFFGELKKSGAEFGYRSASEILRFAAIVNEIAPSWNDRMIFDAAIIQKLLPKVHGSRRKLEPVLKSLAGLCLKDNTKLDEYLKPNFFTDLMEDNNVQYPISLEKIIRMYHNLISNGFTSFAEA